MLIKEGYKNLFVGGIDASGNVDISGNLRVDGGTFLNDVHISDSLDGKWKCRY